MIDIDTQILQIAKDTGLFKKVTLKPFRETVDYPALWIYNVQAAGLESTSTDLTRYQGPWSVDLQIYTPFDNALADDSPEVYAEVKQVASSLLSAILSTMDYKLTDIHFFTGRLAGKSLSIADMSLNNFKTVQL